MAVGSLCKRYGQRTIGIAARNRASRHQPRRDPACNVLQLVTVLVARNEGENDHGPNGHVARKVGQFDTGTEQAGGKHDAPYAQIGGAGKHVIVHAQR